MTDLSQRATFEECARWMHRKAPDGGVPTREFPTTFEVRAKSKGKATVVGYASTTGPDNAYTMRDSLGEYHEEIASGAFASTLAQNPRTQLLLNHGGLAMAYTRAGTLRLSEDSAGLAYEAEVNDARSDVRDMLLAVEDGNVAESSFAFRVVKQSWSPEYDYRKITEVSLDRGDVSVVNFGANPNTPVTVERLALTQASVRQFVSDLDDELRELLANALSPAKPEAVLSNAGARQRLVAVGLRIS